MFKILRQCVFLISLASGVLLGISPTANDAESLFTRFLAVWMSALGQYLQILYTFSVQLFAFLSLSCKSFSFQIEAPPHQIQNLHIFRPISSCPLAFLRMSFQGKRLSL